MLGFLFPYNLRSVETTGKLRKVALISAEIET